VLSADGTRAGVDVDQLMLDAAATSAGVSPSVVSTPGHTSQSSSGPVVQVTSATATTIHVRVTGARAPFWLVLGENRSAGWQATVAGRQHDLGTPTLVDGFANGWMVDPAGSRTLAITLRFGPQRLVDLALIVSAIGLAVCLAVVLRPRRLLPRGTHRVDPQIGTGPAAWDVGGDTGPVLANPFAVPSVLPGVVVALIAAVASGAVGAAIAPKAVMGVGVALLVLLGSLVPRVRGILGFGAVAVVVGTAGYIVVEQATQHFLASGWTNHFERANTLVWAAVLLVGADLVVELLHRARR
jgi:hypothetical protein